MTGTVEFLLSERSRKVDIRHVQNSTGKWGKTRQREIAGWCSEDNFKFHGVLFVTALKPDVVLYSDCEHIVYISELTIPLELMILFEDEIEEAFKRKKLNYAELVAEAREQGWQAHTRPVEIDVRGFVAKSTTRLLFNFVF